MSGDERKRAARNAIVERHTSALMGELEREGYSVVGIAGAVVLEGDGDGRGSRCHGFATLLGDAEARGPGGSAEATCDMLMHDVGVMLLRQVPEETREEITRLRAGQGRSNPPNTDNN